MIRRPVVWRPGARDDLLALYDWIAQASDPQTAFEYTAAIEAKAAELAIYPGRGTPRDDIAPGLRTIVYHRRTVIAYRLDGSAVEVMRLIHAGQDWPSGPDE